MKHKMKPSAYFRKYGRIYFGAGVLAIVLLLAILAILLVLSDGVLPLPVIFLLMFLCAFAGAGLIAHALALLVRRAAALQQESELTI